MSLRKMKHKRLAALLMSSCLGLGTELAFAEEIIDVGPVPINKEAEHHFKLQPYGGSPEKFVVPQGKIYTTTSKTWNHALYGFVEGAYHTVEVQENAIWRPFDIKEIASVENELRIKKKGVVDVGYFFGPENYPDNPIASSLQQTGQKILRNGWGADKWLHANHTVIEDESVLRVNVGNTEPAKFNIETGNLDIEKAGTANKHWLGKLDCSGAPEEKVRLYVEPYYRKTFGGYLALDSGKGSLVEYLDFERENKDTLNFWEHRNTPFWATT